MKRLDDLAVALWTVCVVLVTVDVRVMMYGEGHPAVGLMRKRSTDMPRQFLDATGEPAEWGTSFCEGAEGTNLVWRRSELMAHVTQTVHRVLDIPPLGDKDGRGADRSAPTAGLAMDKHAQALAPPTLHDRRHLVERLLWDGERIGHGDPLVAQPTSLRPARIVFAIVLSAQR